MPVTQCALCFILQEVDASIMREVCSKYFYDQCPAVAGLGEWPRKSALCPSQSVVLASPLPLLPHPPAFTGSSMLRPLRGSAQ